LKEDIFFPGTRKNLEPFPRNWYRRSKVDYRLFNGNPRATLIQRFDGSSLLFGPNGKKIEFQIGATIHEIQTEAEKFGWMIAIEHLHKERESKVG